MAPSPITPAVGTDWKAIPSIRFRFTEHAQFPGIHKVLDNAFSYELDDPDEFFVDGDLRTELHPSAIGLVRAQIVESITSQATSTVDTTTIRPMFDRLLISTRDPTGDFGASLDTALKEKTMLMLFIDPSRLRFATNPPDVRNFDEMQLDRVFNNRNPDGTIKTAAAAPAPALPLGFAPVGGIAPLVGTIHAGTTAVFNVSALPTDVFNRLTDHSDPDKLLSKSDIAEFTDVGSVQDPANVSKQIKVSQLHYLDGGYRIIARNGAKFDLNPQGPDAMKQFFAGFPNLADHQISSVVRWYALIVKLAAAYGLYVHPFECFRSDSNNTKGFTCGDDYFDSSGKRVMYDLPLRFSSNLETYSQNLSTALRKDGVFPKGSYFRTLAHTHYGDGLTTLWQILAPRHPAKMEQPTTLIRNPPVQKADETLADYYYAYVTYLFLRNLIQDINKTLSDPSDFEMFTNGATASSYLWRRVRVDKAITNLKARFDHSQLMTTYNAYLSSDDSGVESLFKKLETTDISSVVPPAIHCPVTEEPSSNVLCNQGKSGHDNSGEINLQ